MILNLTGVLDIETALDEITDSAGLIVQAENEPDLTVVIAMANPEQMRRVGRMLLSSADTMDGVLAVRRLTSENFTRKMWDEWMRP